MQPDDAESEMAVAPVTEDNPSFRLDELARESGLLPENLFGGVTGRQIQQNPKFWLYRVICERYRWNEHSRITKSEFDAAIAAVSHFSV